jgi:hypothetical protein
MQGIFLKVLLNLTKQVNFKPPNLTFCPTRIFNQTTRDLSRLKSIDFMGSNTTLMTGKKITKVLKKL